LSGAIETPTAWVECRPDGQLAWSVASKNLISKVSEIGPNFLNVADVHGSIYKLGQRSAVFHADRGSGTQNSVLELNGNVVVTSVEESRILTCDDLKWDPQRRVAIATGNVRYQAIGTTAGPFPEIWAAPDLGTLGTPDMMK
jgi:hypothetical protein